MFEVFFTSAALVSVLVTYVTNPFSRFSIVKLPFRARLEKSTLETVNNNSKLKTRNNFLWRWFAIYQCGLYIVTTRYFHSPPAKSQTVDGIIRDIHALRYNPNKLLLISGDHFNGLFVRNLGVFYYPMLDTQIVSNEHDWQNRQLVYLQTVAYALGVFEKNPVPTTTIVSKGRYGSTCVYFYAYPSDTVYGIFYALAALAGKEKARAYDYGKDHNKLDTVSSARSLIDIYKLTLDNLYKHYRQTAFDDQTGLVRKNVHMSGAKDITRRESAFYDNVIFWKTTELAMKLNVIKKDTAFLSRLKKKIIQSFWLEEDGYFLEDLSDEGIKNKYYSSDWLIVLATGFLDPSKSDELAYFERSVQYIRDQKIDQPFPIKYQQETRAHRQFLAVRLAVASYGGDSIWSFWGMEYIKVLCRLYEVTGKHDYIEWAEDHIAAYEDNIIKNQGFPEVYDKNGKLLQTLFYRSIRQTGWVIGFEQAREIWRSYKNTR